jgi:hypothetical protein
LWSGWLGNDLSRFSLDDPVAVTDNEYLKSSVAMFGQGQWTLRDFVDAHAIDAEGAPQAVWPGHACPKPTARRDTAVSQRR